MHHAAIEASGMLERALLSTPKQKVAPRCCADLFRRLIDAKALPGAYASCPGYIAQLKMFSIHRLGSVSLTLPKYLWVVERLACRRIILLTISMGAPDLLA